VHAYDADTEALGRAILEYAQHRLRLDPVPLDGPRTAADLVDVVAGQEETTRHKPHPEPLLFAAATLGVDPRECVYVGDATVDVEAARAAGMGAVAVLWGAGEPGALRATAPDAVVADVAALKAVLLPPTRP
jgi:pyrophosphatase PpaX